MSDKPVVPKNFIIRCPKCRWARTTSGIKTDLTDLVEVQKSCATCGKSRKFRCPKCGASATMVRMRANT